MLLRRSFVALFGLAACACAGSSSTAQDSPAVVPVLVQAKSIDVTPLSDAAPSSTDARVMNAAAVVSVQNRSDANITVTRIRIDQLDRGPFSFPATSTGFDQLVSPGDAIELRCPLSVHTDSAPDTTSPNRVALRVTLFLAESGPFTFNLYAPVFSVSIR